MPWFCCALLQGACTECASKLNKVAGCTSMHALLQELHICWDMTAPIFSSISQLQRLQSLRVTFQVGCQALAEQFAACGHMIS
jgi:hypothetical protein